MAPGTFVNDYQVALPCAHAKPNQNRSPICCETDIRPLPFGNCNPRHCHQHRQKNTFQSFGKKRRDPMFITAVRAASILRRPRAHAFPPSHHTGASQRTLCISGFRVCGLTATHARTRPLTHSLTHSPFNLPACLCPVGGPLRERRPGDAEAR